MGRKYAGWLLVAPLTVLPLLTAKTALAQYTISTLAQSTTSFTISAKNGIAVDAGGNVYTPATVPEVVVMEVNTKGALRVVGSNQPNAPFPGCGMTATNIGMTDLGGVAVDTLGNLYVAQSGNGPVLRVSGGIVSCLDAATYFGAIGIAADNVGNSWISLGVNGNSVYEITSGGTRLTVAGTGAFGCSGGSLGNPEGLALDSSGNLYIADSWCNVVWKLTPGGNLSVFAGIPGNGGTTGGFSGDFGPATKAQLSQPTSVAVDAKGSVYIADWANNRIRRVRNGIITTIAGNGFPGYTGDGGYALSAELSGPWGIAVSGTTVYFTDQSGSSPVIRQLTFHAPGDLDGDNVPDVFLQAPDGSIGVWYLSANGPQLTITGFAFLSGPISGITLVDVADLDGDGFPDLILRFSDGAIGVWYLGGPTHTAITGFVFISGPNQTWMPVAMADLNNDGHPDMIVQNATTGAIAVWYLGGKLGNQIQGTAEISGPTTGWKLVGMADLNNDGHPDAIIQHTDGEIGVWYLGGAQGNTIEGFAPIAGPSTWSVVGTADMNDDGHPDLVIRATDGTLGVWYLGGTEGNVITGFDAITSPGNTSWKELVVH